MLAILSKRNSAAVVALALAGLLMPGQADAQLRYGPWKVVGGTCEEQRIVGPFGNGPISPEVPGATPFLTCKYCREVEECPRLRDKLRHLIQCTRRLQCKKEGGGPPRD